jgi:translation elongation factor EF-1beta
MAVLGNRGPHDDRIDGVAVTLSVRERLQDHQTGAFTADIPVGFGIEGLRTAGRREESALRRGNGEVRREH